MTNYLARPALSRTCHSVAAILNNEGDEQAPVTEGKVYMASSEWYMLKVLKR